MPTPNTAIQALLAKRLYATLATHNDDGSIHQTPVYYLFENDKLYMPSSPRSRKTHNAIIRPNVSVIIDVRKVGEQQWASATGTVEIIDGEAATQINARIFQRYMTEAALADSEIGPIIQSLAEHDVTLCLTPKIWRGWDIASLNLSEKMMNSPDRWYLPLDG